MPERAALVTGASSGIGLAIAAMLPNAGRQLQAHGSDLREVSGRIRAGIA